MVRNEIDCLQLPVASCDSSDCPKRTRSVANGRLKERLMVVLVQYQKIERKWKRGGEDEDEVENSSSSTKLDHSKGCVGAID